MESSDSPSPFEPLYASDLAQQVRETFTEMIGFGASPVAATQETVHRFGGLLSDEREGPVIILTLAALQVEQRTLFASIRDAALELIDSGRAAQLVAPAHRREGEEVLGELGEILRSVEVEEDEDDDADEDDGDAGDD